MRHYITELTPKHQVRLARMGFIQLPNGPWEKFFSVKIKTHGTEVVDGKLRDRVKIQFIGKLQLNKKELITFSAEGYSDLMNKKTRRDKRILKRVGILNKEAANEALRNSHRERTPQRRDQGARSVRS